MQVSGQCSSQLRQWCTLAVMNSQGIAVTVGLQDLVPDLLQDMVHRIHASAHLSPTAMVVCFCWEKEYVQLPFGSFGWPCSKAENEPLT
jgi:hypothetical protein